MKLQYRQNNAYSFVLAFTDDHADVYYMDGTDEYPIFDDEYIDNHPEYESKHGDMAFGHSAYYRPCIEAAALDYLRRIAPEISLWSGAEFEADREDSEPVEDFLSRICVDCDHEDEIISEYDTEEAK